MNDLTSYLTSGKPVASVILIIIAAVCVCVVGHIGKRYYRKSDFTDLRAVTLIKSIFKGIKATIIVFAVLGLLQINGFNISSIVAGIGVFGAVIGIAMQDLIKDIIMGFHILNDRSFKIGDVVKYKEDEGEVKDFSLFSTRIESINTGDIVTICNRNISEIALSCGIYDIDVPLGYEEDGGKIAAALSEAAAEAEKTEGIDKAEYLDIQSYEPPAAIYRVRIWCSPKVKWPMRRAAMKAVHRSLRKAGLELSYNKFAVTENEKC